MGERILSYSEFMSMTVFDFERIYALYVFKNEEVTRKMKAQENKEVASKLSSLPTINAKELGLTDEQIEGLKNGNR